MRERLSQDSLIEVLDQIKDIPSMPEAVTRINERLINIETSAVDIAKLISCDPGLTSKILRLVNSSAYGFQQQISSLQHAIMILGFSTIRGLVFSASIFKLFQQKRLAPGFDYKGFWSHSLGTAMVAKKLAKLLHVGNEDTIFSAAMLHDIGQVILAVYYPEPYSQVLNILKNQKNGYKTEAFTDAIEEEILGVTHAQMGHAVALRWQLPEDICHVIQYHHQPDKIQEYEDLVYTIALADEMIKIERFHDLEAAVDGLNPVILEYFKLNSSQTEALILEVKSEMDSMEDFCSRFLS